MSREILSDEFNGTAGRMATRLTWRIQGVTSTTSDGKPGVVIRYPSPGGGHKEFVVRPTADPQETFRAAFYLYHAPASELPSHPGHPERTAREERDDPEFNQHFGAFYDVFRPRIDAKLPERIPDDDDEEEDDEEPEDGDDADDVESGLEEKDASQLAGASGRQFRAMSTSGYHGFHGRLYTCTVATTLDRDTPP